MLNRPVRNKWKNPKTFKFHAFWLDFALIPVHFEDFFYNKNSEIRDGRLDNIT